MGGTDDTEEGFVSIDQEWNTEEGFVSIDQRKVLFVLITKAPRGTAGGSE